MKKQRVLVAAVCAVVVTMPLIGRAQHGNLTHQQPPTTDAVVGFGVFPTAPLGPPPCTQVAPFGGAADPCAFKIHHLTPEEVTVVKGSEVTFQIHNGGHAPAIYEVSKDTTRDEIGQFLCPGNDPATIDTPANHVCAPGNANAAHVIADGHGDVVIVASANVTNVHPDNRVWYVPGRLMSNGGIQFANGGTTPANGELVTYKFLKNGRYLVICMNRAHFLNDWMFGFVNVIGG